MIKVKKIRLYCVEIMKSLVTLFVQYMPPYILYKARSYKFVYEWMKGGPLGAIYNKVLPFGGNRSIS